MSGEPPTKKARVSVEDSEMLPITEGTQDFEEFELEDINIQIAVQASLAKEQKIEEKTKEIEPSQPATNLFFSATCILQPEEDVERGIKKQGNPTVGVEMQSTVDLKNVLKKVWQSSYGSQDNMSVMMTGP